MKGFPGRETTTTTLSTVQEVRLPPSLRGRRRGPVSWGGGCVEVFCKSLERRVNIHVYGDVLLTGLVYNRVYWSYRDNTV